jgi:hypothetical protein
MLYNRYLNLFLLNFMFQELDYIHIHIHIHTYIHTYIYIYIYIYIVECHRLEAESLSSQVQQKKMYVS